MAKYEIMLIVDPKEDFEVVERLAQEAFGHPQVRKLPRTELAYEINKSKTAHYALIHVEASGAEIKELTRKVNISKKIWRMLVINLDTETGMNKSLELIQKRKEQLAREHKEWLRQKESRIRESQERQDAEGQIKAKEGA